MKTNQHHHCKDPTMAIIKDVPPPPSSSSVQIRKWTNHVFLSFRGEDTRKGFTDHIFFALERRGIKTFKDDYDLPRGELISEGLINAIKKSMFALIVLSPNYASSSWCLDELQTIVECRSKFGQQFLPVFYGVEPSDVRHQRGTFKEAFAKHEQSFKEDGEKVKRWRDALEEVAGYSGWNSKDKYEAALIETVVDHIHKILIPKLPSWADNLIGLEKRITELSSLIGMKLDDIRFIGIWGMGGIGKTTIARLVYESIKEDFIVSCFLANIREMCATNGIVHIQRELLSHLNVRHNYFHNSFDGKKIIANSLCNKKVLLVLDDISHLSQLNHLAGKQEWFGPGSRILITTRDKHLLVTHGVHQTCELEGLVSNEALHLFCLKAFKRDWPRRGYLDLCKEVVEYTKGLPLALEVLGSYLYGRAAEVWHSALKQIRSSSHPEIQNSLKISYDDLHNTEKEMFLNIACFFKGMDKDEVIEILENCGYFPKIGIEILVEKSLITLGGTNILEMHDLLQEMGRNIVFQESPIDPGKRSRLWSPNDISSVLTKNKGTEAIQAIVLNSVEPYEARWSVEAFSNTSQLWLLKLCEVQLPMGLNCLPCALKVLEWRGCPLKTLPLLDHMDIVDIKLSHSKIELLWHGTKILERLKSINLSFSKNLNQTPDFSEVPNLESLVLEGCTSLTIIHSSLVHLKKIVQLNLKDCKKLKALTGKMEMSSLKYLDFSGCSELKTVPEFGGCMKHLSMLSFEGTAITKLPSSLGCLVGLAVLKLKNCKNLVCLPDSICKLTSLKILNVSGCKGMIPKLSSFLPFKCVSGCVQAPTSFGVPFSISCPCFLTSLNLSYCNLSAESILDGFCSLSFLRSLNLSGNKFVTLSNNISKQSKLEYLGLNGCKKLKLLPELPLNLKRLDASNCTSLVTSTFQPSRLPSRRLKTYEPPSIQLHIPTELKNLFKGLRFAATTFEMVIPGSDIPSWFAPQKFSSYAEKPFFTAFPPTEGVGYAVCFLLESAKPSQMCRHKITCSIGRRTQSKVDFSFLHGDLDLPRRGRSLKGKQSKVDPLGHQKEKKVDPAIIITSRNLPLMLPNSRHLYILCVH
ncbi:hypothetical protein PIB30_062233 [Stylosanthes scabra]|uniref:TIR domain-containing protein n=1 Tax=Stylosanthes scabra TaxID=79078 RepID=A0ABU6TKV4_9FABA|nr:hypothetical protein [Stylosanthes scabra]